MPIFPPKVTHSDKALEFLSELAVKEGEPEYTALRKAIMLQLGSAPTLLIVGTWMMCFLSRGGQWMDLVLGGVIIAIGLVGVITAQRLVGLLELFSSEIAVDSKKEVKNEPAQMSNKTQHHKSDRAGDWGG